MKLATLVIALLCTACNAQQAVRAPVNVATELYKGCLNATLQNESLQLEPSRPAIFEFVEQLDDNCLGWTIIWFRPLMGFNLTDRQDILDRFTNNRRVILTSLRKELVQLSQASR